MILLEKNAYLSMKATKGRVKDSTGPRYPSRGPKTLCGRSDNYDRGVSGMTKQSSVSDENWKGRLYVAMMVAVVVRLAVTSKTPCGPSKNCRQTSQDAWGWWTAAVRPPLGMSKKKVSALVKNSQYLRVEYEGSRRRIQCGLSSNCTQAEVVPVSSMTTVVPQAAAAAAAAAAAEGCKIHVGPCSRLLN